MCVHYIFLITNFKRCLHNEETNPGVLTLLSPKPERLGSFFNSCSLLDISGLEEEEDDDDDDVRESKRQELHDESSESFCFSPVRVKRVNSFSQNKLILMRNGK